MYIAHHLITIDSVFQHRLLLQATTTGHPRGDHPRGEAGGQHEGCVGRQGSTLSELVCVVKRLGNDNFTQHVALQKQQLIDRLRTNANGQHLLLLS